MIDIEQLVSQHWPKLAFMVAGAAISLAWKYYHDRKRWRSRQQIETLHLSNNTIEYRQVEVQHVDGKGVSTTEAVTQPWLILDGIFEDDLSSKVSNRYVQQLIRRAVAKTTIDQPFLRFGNDEDHWFVMNMIRMGIAEIKGGVALEKLGSQASVTDVCCVFAVTYERWPGMRQGKIRIMLAREDEIESDRFSQDFQYEDPQHVDRPKTLQQMSRDYKGEKAYTMMVRIPVRVSNSR